MFMALQMNPPLISSPAVRVEGKTARTAPGTGTISPVKAANQTMALHRIAGTPTTWIKKLICNGESDERERLGQTVLWWYWA